MPGALLKKQENPFWTCELEPNAEGSGTRRDLLKSRFSGTHSHRNLTQSTYANTQSGASSRHPGAQLRSPAASSPGLPMVYPSKVDINRISVPKMAAQEHGLKPFTGDACFSTLLSGVNLGGPSFLGVAPWCLSY